MPFFWGGGCGQEITGISSFFCLFNDVQTLLFIFQGKLKSKRLSGLVTGLKSSDLGPYSGGSYKSPGGKSVTLTATSLKDLQPECNKEKVVLGSVVCSLRSDDPVPL